jgi:hypothetical protein
VVAEAQVGIGTEAPPAIIPRVTGSAYITGLHQLLLDSRDLFPHGFALACGAESVQASLESRDYTIAAEQYMIGDGSHFGY